MAAPGFLIRSAFQREVSGWPPVASEATGLVPLLSESVRMESQHEGIYTVDRQTHTTLTSRTVTGDISLGAHYVGLEFYLAAALGFISPVLPSTVETGVYQHVFEVDNTLSEEGWLAGEGWEADMGLIAGDRKVRHGTYVIDKQTAFWESNGVMLGGFTFQANPAAVTFTSSVMGYLTQYASVSDLSVLSCAKEMITFSDVTLYITSIAPITSADIISDIVGVSITLDNALEAVHTVESKKAIGEPRRGSIPTVTGSFALPFYGSIGPQLQTWADNDTRLFALVECVGQEIGASSNFLLRFWMPCFKLTSYDIGVQGPQQLQQVYSFIANTADETTEGLPTTYKTGPLIVELVNENSQNALL